MKSRGAARHAPEAGRAAARPSDPQGLDVRDTPAGASLRVRVQPRSSQEAIAGVREGALLVRLTAPPVEGAANAALLRVLGKALGVPPSAIALARGAHGRDKVVCVAGRSAADLSARLSPSGGGS